MLSFTMSKELLDNVNKAESKLDFAKIFLCSCQKTFPDKRIMILADGLFSKYEILGCCTNEKIDCEMRIHSNRKIEYDGKS